MEAASGRNSQGDPGTRSVTRLTKSPTRVGTNSRFAGAFCQVLLHKNLTHCPRCEMLGIMAITRHHAKTPQGITARTVRQRIEAGGERVWRFADFEGMPFSAVAQTLSRLTRQGIIQRLGKGMYYRTRQTALGTSRPNNAQIRSLPMGSKRVFPAGISAANLLGFTTQNPARPEVSTDSNSLPRQIVGKETIIHTRRPASWHGLSETEAALLDFIRDRGALSELSPQETVNKLLQSLRLQGRFKHLAEVAMTEPPRVRAILGAIGQQLGLPEKQLAGLRKSLNTLSRFDFGNLAALEHARQWQAKERRSGETI